jgi:hypothetical protein
MGGRGILRILGVIAAAALLAAPPAGAGDNDIQGASVAVARQKDGPYKGYTGDVKVPEGKTKDLWFRVNGAGSLTETIDLRFLDDGSSSDEDYKVKWFKGKKNVSQDVKNEGYSVTVGKSQKRYFRASITDVGPEEGLCLEGEIVFDMTLSEFAAAGIETECAF